jgi:bifunctional non-homologous end joining protein LigD
VPELIKPMLAVAGTLPDAAHEPQWAFEMKWDGVRAVVYAEGGAEVTARSRNDRDVTVSYPEVASVRDSLGAIDAVLDGELVAFDPTTGRPSFATLQNRMHIGDRASAARLAARIPITYVVFDVLRLQGESLLRLPYRDRRELLEQLEIRHGSAQTVPVFYGEQTSGADIWRASTEQGMEGVVCKRLDSPYEAGRRSPYWRKVKHFLDQEVVIGGWRPGAGRRGGRIGSLMMGLPEPGGLRYIGQVGTGFTDSQLDALGRLFARVERASTPFLGSLPNAVTADAHWLEPTIVGEVAFGEWTGDGILRHPSWRGLRPDKSPADIVAVAEHRSER